MTPYILDQYISGTSKFFDKTLCNKLRSLSILSILSDEATAVNNNTYLSIFTRYIDPSNYYVVESFRGLVKLGASHSFAALMEAIKKVFEQKQIDMKNIYFSGFDGTNAMSSEINALQRKIQDEAPHSIYINCRCHRFALVFHHLIKN